MTAETIFFEVGVWLIMALLAWTVLLLFLNLIQRFRLVFRALDRLSMPGTIIHEFGHYIMCKAYGIQIDEVKWFHWGYMLNYEKALHQTGGTTGYVRPAEPAPNMFVQFQISAAPLMSGGLFWLLSIGGIHLVISKTSPISDALPPLYETILVAVLLWVGLAAAARMLPSNRDMEIVLNWPPTNLLERLIGLIAWLIRSMNGLLRNYHKGVRVWSVVTTLTTLFVLLQYSIPGGQSYLESFGIIAVVIRDIGEAVKDVR